MARREMVFCLALSRGHLFTDGPVESGVGLNFNFNQFWFLKWSR